MAKRSITKAEQAFRDFVGRKPCLVCGGPATIHHVTGDSFVMGRLSRREDRIVPLCPMHHQAVHDPKASDPVSVENLNHRGFYKRHGVDLLGEAERLWRQYNAA